MLNKRWWTRSSALRERVLDLRIRESTSTTLVVREREGHRELVEIGEREMVHTRVRLGKPLISGFPYSDAMHAARWLCSRRAVKPSRVLCLGGGGFLIPQQLRALEASVEVDAVEHAKDVIDLARAYFIIEERPEFTIHCTDAAEYLARTATTASYDIIFIDLFGAFEASALLAKVGFFMSVERALSEGGAIAVNMVGALDGSGGAMLATIQAMHIAFRGQVLTLPMMSPKERKSKILTTNEPRNVIAFATKSSLPPSIDVASSPPLLPLLDDALLDLNRQLQSLASARNGGASMMRLVFDEAG